MRTWHPYLYSFAFALAACSGGSSNTTATSGDTDTDSGSGTETSGGTTTTTSSSSSSTNGGTMSGSMGSTGSACVPGQSVACVCIDGTNGSQVCAPDGMSFEPCECVGTTTNSTSTTDPTTSTTDPTTTDPTTTTDTTGDMTTGDMTTGDMTTGNVCDDPGPEPNETEMEAVDLGNTQCFNEPGMFEGVLNGDQDVDFFHFHGQDGMSCGFADPEASATVTAGQDVLVCIYIDCDQGNNDFGCSGGAQDSMSPGGLPGCCDTNNVTIGYNCSGTMNESANIYISLSGAPPDSCLMYSVEWDFAAG